MVLSDASGVVATVYLQGTGVGPQIAFDLAYNLQSLQTTTIPASLTYSAVSVAVDGSGNVYIGDSPTGCSTGEARVLKETLSDGQYTQSIIRTGLGFPSYLAVDGAGNVYISDSGTQSGNSCGPVNAAIYKETPFNGGYTETTINAGIAGSYIAVDGSGNISGIASSSVFAAILQSDGSYQSTPVTLPTIPNGGTLDTLDAITADGSGNLYISAYYTVDNMYNGYMPTVYPWVFEETLSSGSYVPSSFGIGGDGVKDETYYPQMEVEADALGNIYWWPESYGQLVNLVEYMPAGYANGNSSLWPILPAITGPVWEIDVDAGGNMYMAYGDAGVYKLDASDSPPVSFEPTSEGVTSLDSPKNVEIINIGNAPLTISTISFPADFPEPAESGSCTVGLTLTPTTICSINIDFTPIATLGSSTSQVLNESVDITTNASPATQEITVTGTEIDLPAATPTFSIPGGTYASQQAVSLSDTTTGATIYYTTDGVTTPTINSTQFNSGTPILVSSTETIQAIAVAPGFSYSALASATYTIPPDFTVAINPASISVQAGQPGSTTITVQDKGGFNSNVSFACSGLPIGDACTFSTLTVPTPAGVSYSTLTVSTTSAAATLRRNSRPLLPASTLAFAICCLGWKKRRRLQMLLILAVSIVALGMLTGCGGSATTVQQHQPVTSTVTVTATSGSLSHSTTFTLTVN